MTAITPRIRHANDPWRDWVDIPRVTATDVDDFTPSVRMAVSMVRHAIGDRASVVAVTHAIPVAGPQHAVHVLIRDITGDHIVQVPYRLALAALRRPPVSVPVGQAESALAVAKWVWALDCHWGWHP